MSFATVNCPGADALRLLNEHRYQYPRTRQHPFLNGDAEDYELLQGNMESGGQDPLAILRSALEVDLNEWMAMRRAEAEEYGFSAEEAFGRWPGEIREKGSIGLHKDIVSGKVKREDYLGLATIEQPWHLPAMMQYGSWNECPDAEVHCEFHRRWQEEFGANITGMSGNVVECVVENPPTDQETAIRLAWQQ